MMAGILKYIAVFTLAASGVTDPRLARQDWSVVSVTYGGTVSIERNLSLRQAAQIAEKLYPGAYVYHGQIERRRQQRERARFEKWIFRPASRDLITISYGTIRMVSDSDIKNVWVIGPEGWENGCMEGWDCN